ncbi:hypothetical protein O181_106455 [Austropuccinia psidii MF-1]|uniref:Uncharacterized protein n=1 Tax=Austropuccinia psidii MF-1 TaxID=1389203 RepID=A0A9Q3JSI9_9BASI|nr:hypothetical protein [Austropuccinia psidii MF-1]
MLRLCAYKNDRAMVQLGEFDIAISIVQLKCSPTEHFNYDPKANLSNGLRQAHAVFNCLTAPPLFKHYYQAIRPVIPPQSLVAKCTTFFSAWGIWELHPPCKFHKGLTTTLLGDRVAI